jgi:hypothetical protein
MEQVGTKEMDFSFLASGPSVDYKYIAMYHFFKTEIRKDTFLLSVRHLTNDAQFQEYVEKWAGELEKTHQKKKASLMNIDGYEIPLDKYAFAPTFYYGMSGELFVSGIYKVVCEY